MSGLGELLRATRRYEGPPFTAQETHARLLEAYEELRVAEEELRSQQELLVQAQKEIDVERTRYRTLFELAPDPYVVTDRHGLIEQANNAAGELFGVAHTQLIGKPIINFIDLHARPHFRAQLHELSMGLHSEKMVIEFTVREGRLLPIETAVAAIATSTGSQSFCWLLRDRTIQRDNEESMRALNRSLNARVAQRTRELEIALAGEQAARKEAEAANRIKCV
jgi:PAS domain S-box-containing protein